MKWHEVVSPVHASQMIPFLPPRVRSLKEATQMDGHIFPRCNTSISLPQTQTASSRSTNTSLPSSLSEDPIDIFDLDTISPTTFDGSLITAWNKTNAPLIAIPFIDGLRHFAMATHTVHAVNIHDRLLGVKMSFKSRFIITSRTSSRITTT
mmetsp:Transcript_13312/g.25426  ORF Transcript_13312/g.25426 Transcript_13312/m.25426 type:complete len:151 (-) Transcript_13312:579-1031(-)